jgi:hypothetical protein
VASKSSILTISDVNSLWAINTCCAGAFALLRVQIAFAISDAKTLRAFSTSCASSFTVFSVLIADSISRTGDADLADHQHQTKKPHLLRGRVFYLVPVAGLEQYSAGTGIVDFYELYH